MRYEKYCGASLSIIEKDHIILSDVSCDQIQNQEPSIVIAIVVCDKHYRHKALYNAKPY